MRRLKTLLPVSGTELRSLRVLLWSDTKECAHALTSLLRGMDLAVLSNVSSLDKAAERLRGGQVDVIIADVEHGGLMLPSLLNAFDAAMPLPRFPHVLWLIKESLDADLPVTLLDESDGLNRPVIGTLSMQGLLSHMRLARQAGIHVGLAVNNSKAAIDNALRALQVIAPVMRQPAHTVTADAPCESDVIEALTTGNNMRLMLQPQYDLRTRRIIGAEALLRWRHPICGDVPPSVLIPIVNRLGLHLLLFSFIETRVIRVLLALKSHGVELPIAMNASAETVCTPGLAERLAVKMARAGLRPGLLKIELTEDLPVLDDLCLSASLNALQAQGFLVSLDDFGTGSATLSLLSKMAFDEVKIDGSFIWDMKVHGPSRAVIVAIVALTIALGIKLVAEGIEEASCIAALLQLGCHSGQGYALAHPMEFDDFLDIVSAA